MALDASTAPASPSFTRDRIPLDQIEIHDDFLFRAGYLNGPHLRDLRQVLTNNPRKAFDPVTVWRDADGTVYLLDGLHRAEAYRQAGQEARRVPVRVYLGDRDGAVLVALEGNAKARLPLSSMERQDAAWRLVRLPQREKLPRYSKPQIIAAAGVSDGLVAAMRRRWRAVVEAGPEAVAKVTGRWSRDRADTPSSDDFVPLDDAERDRQIDALSGEYRDLTDRRKRGNDLPILGDSNAIYEALHRAYGDPWLRGLWDYLMGGEAEGWDAPFAEFHRPSEHDEDGLDAPF